MFLHRSLSTLNRTLRPTIRQLLSKNAPLDLSTPIQVNGWVKSIRRQKRVAFAVITDGSSSQGLQAVFTDVALARSLTNGAAVSLTGVLADSVGPGQDMELQVHGVDVVGECNPETYPIQKQTLSIEYLRDHCHLRARTDQIAAMMRLRHSTLESLHNYFGNEGFCYTHTPILTSNDCEGTGETFRVTSSSFPAASTPSGKDKTERPEQVNASKSSDEFFGRPAYLTVSSQLHLEAASSSISRVYTVSPCFRAERSQTGRHLAEFWMLEAEWAFADTVEDLCQVAENSIKAALRQPSSDLTVLQKNMIDGRLRCIEDAASAKPWARITYTQAMQELQKEQEASHRFKFPVGWGHSLQSEHERWLAEQLVNGPVFVTDYPVEQKPFYMRHNAGEDTVGCFDLLVPHLGELVGGSLREEREAQLIQALDDHDLDSEDYRWYIDIRKYGGAPHGGFGIGFERLISWMSGIENVRECIPMPRWAGRMLL